MTAPRETDPASRGQQGRGDTLRIGIIGGGFMGEAFLRGLLRAGVAQPNDDAHLRGQHAGLHFDEVLLKADAFERQRRFARQEDGAVAILINVAEHEVGHGAVGAT